MSTPEPARMDRRVALKWMLAASAGAVLAHSRAFLLAAAETGAAPRPAGGYGTDPDLMMARHPGDFWPLTFTPEQRREAAALCDVVIPADAQSPSASALGVTDFIDEWVSAPYPEQQADGHVIVAGLAWLDAEARRQFGAGFADATAAERVSLCSAIAPASQPSEDLKAASRFFRKFRNLTASGFYTTPVGMKDLGYVGNVPLARFEGPPPDLVARLGLTDEVKW